MFADLAGDFSHCFMILITSLNDHFGYFFGGRERIKQYFGLLIAHGSMLVGEPATVGSMTMIFFAWNRSGSLLGSCCNHQPGWYFFPVIIKQSSGCSEIKKVMSKTSWIDFNVRMTELRMSFANAGKHKNMKSDY